MIAETSDVDLVGPQAVRDPHAVFAELRGRGPVHWLEHHRAWLLLDYDLVRLGLTDDRLSTDTITHLYERLSPDDRAEYRDVETLLRGWMIFNDPPTHTQLRDPVRVAFTPRAVAQLRDQIADATDELLHGLRSASEFVGDVAFPLPANVIAVLLGVPGDHYEQMRSWSIQLGALVMGKTSRVDAWERAVWAAREMQAYFGELIEHYRRAPADNLVSRMVHAGFDADVGELSTAQLIGACSLLLFAGHETTTSLLTTGVYHLATRPDLREQVVGQPDAADRLVDELMRFDGPSKIMVRRVRDDCEWEGYPMRRGQAVFCAIMAANRDPAVFDDPDQLHIERHPNRHLGFGWGPHFCLGAQLAKLEAEVAIPRVVERFPSLRLATDPADVSWHATVVGRTIRKLRLALD
jgi:cytochrome P450